MNDATKQAESFTGAAGLIYRDRLARWYTLFRRAGLPSRDARERAEQHAAAQTSRISKSMPGILATARPRLRLAASPNAMKSAWITFQRIESQNALSLTRVRA